jgi:hypothetical protein
MLAYTWWDIYPACHEISCLGQKMVYLIGQESSKTSFKSGREFMKIIRSSKCSLKYLTQKKAGTLKDVLTEYGKVVNFFIEQFWQATPSKGQLLKDVLNRPTTWLTARLKKVAARE